MKAQHPINARAETVATGGMFRDAFDRRRAIVPASAFYEWQAIGGEKQPYAIAREDGPPLAFAGLVGGLRLGDGTMLRTFATSTTDAAPDVADPRDRMPMILEAETGWPGWARRTRSRCVVHPSPAGTLAYGRWTSE